LPVLIFWCYFFLQTVTMDTDAPPPYLPPEMWFEVTDKLKAGRHRDYLKRLKRNSRTLEKYGFVYTNNLMCIPKKHIHKISGKSLTLKNKSGVWEQCEGELQSIGKKHSPCYAVRSKRWLMDVPVDATYDVRDKFGRHQFDQEYVGDYKIYIIGKAHPLHKGVRKFPTHKLYERCEKHTIQLEDFWAGVKEMEREHFHYRKRKPTMLDRFFTKKARPKLEDEKGKEKEM